MKYVPQSIILKPIITEKTTLMREKGNKYVFEVARKANKKEIKKAVEEIFKVKVKNINVMNVLGKMRRLRNKEGRTSSWKKAVVTLQKDEKIDILGV